MNTLRFNTLDGEGYPGPFTKYQEKLFYGKIYEDGFQIVHLLADERGHMPLIQGKVTGDENGTNLHVTIRMCKPSIAFLIAFESFAALMSTIGLVITLTKGFTSLLVFPLILIFWVYLLIRFQFKLHAERNTAKLVDLVKDKRTPR